MQEAILELRPRPFGNPKRGIKCAEMVKSLTLLQIQSKHELMRHQENIQEVLPVPTARLAPSHSSK